MQKIYERQCKRYKKDKIYQYLNALQPQLLFCTIKISFVLKRSTPRKWLCSPYFFFSFSSPLSLQPIRLRRNYQNLRTFQARRILTSNKQVKSTEYAHKIRNLCITYKDYKRNILHRLRFWCVIGCKEIKGIRSHNL